MNEKIILNERKSKIALILVLTILMQIFMPIFTGTSKVYAETTETLLTTITPTGKSNYSETTAGVVTVSHNNDYYDGTYGWLWYDAVDTLTVSACEGYTITKCIFKQNAKSPVTDSSAPFELHFDSMGQWGGVLCRENYDMDGVTSIEVYGYANPTIVTSTIILNTNGGSINSGNITTYDEGTGATLPTDVTREGYIFLGWYDNENLTGSAVTSIPTTDTGDKTFYAKWVENLVGNIYKDNIAINYWIKIKDKNNDTAILNAGTHSFTIEKRTSDNEFLVRINGSKLYISGDITKDAIGIEITGGSGTNADPYTLGIAYTTKSSVILDTNGGTINSGNITEYTEGTGATLPTDVTKDGYTFEGWFANEGLTGNPVTEISATDTGDKEYWAKWTTATCTVTFNPNGGRVSNKYPLQDLTVNKGTDFKLPSLPSLPEIAYIDAGMYIVVASPEGKVFDAFEVDGERKNPKDIITINNDTVIKYLWKDVTYIHEINLTIEAPIVGVKVDAEWNDVLNSLDYSTQTNRPIVTVPDGVNYMVEDEVTYWYDGDYNVFTGTIEKDTTYKASIYVCGIEDEYQIADDVKVTVNGEEITTFDNQEFWIDIDYSIDSVDSYDKVKYTINSNTNSGDSISFTELEGDIYSFYIKDRLSTTDEDIQHVVDLFDDPEFTFEALKEQLNKLITYGKNAAGESGTLLKLYEMYLYNNGVEIHEIEGGFKLRLKITDDMKGYDSYKLIYISEEDGTIEKAIELTKNGEYLEGVLPHLSIYALVGSNAETNNPKTGDNIAIWFSLMVISILGIAGTAKLHKKNK